MRNAAASVMDGRAKLPRNFALSEAAGAPHNDVYRRSVNERFEFELVTAAPSQ
jgi:hypothetical protein